MEDPTDFSWLLTGNDARDEPIPRATAAEIEAAKEVNQHEGMPALR